MDQCDGKVYSQNDEVNRKQFCCFADRFEQRA